LWTSHRAKQIRIRIAAAIIVIDHVFEVFRLPSCVEHLPQRRDLELALAGARINKRAVAPRDSDLVKLFIREVRPRGK